MSADSPLEAEVGPWAREKLDALERYLDYYTKVLKNQSQWQTIFLDAFAGGGRARIRGRKQSPSPEGGLDLGVASKIDAEQQEFILGSPRRSLEIANPFDSYIFIDADRTRIQMLRDLKAEYGDRRRITVREGTAASEVAWVLSKKPDPARHRGVAFLDPFGAHMEWQTVSALASTGVFEVLINLPLDMAINRLIKVNGQMPENWRAQLDAFFPVGWWDEAYSTDPGLFLGLPEGTNALEKRRDARARLLRFYMAHLKDAFGLVSQPKLIRNTKGHPLYYLLWAGSHPKGLQGANYVLAMGERLPGTGRRPG
ncbi:MAG: three-Cys-motif partner protein TcmP [Caulobacter sp.]